jgi:hypothetical protein
MHIASHGIVQRSLYAAYCGVHYAAYWDKGQIGMIIGRSRDDRTIYLQGDDAANLEKELDVACTSCGDDDGRAMDLIDIILDAYGIIEWNEFETTRCAPSSDLMLLNYYN